MKISKEWLKRKIEQDPEEPGGIMAMSPRIYAYSRAVTFADRNETAGYLLNVALLEAVDHSDDSHDRFIWAMNRVVRYVKRVTPK